MNVNLIKSNPFTVDDSEHTYTLKDLVDYYAIPVLLILKKYYPDNYQKRCEIGFSRFFNEISLCNLAGIGECFHFDSPGNLRFHIFECFRSACERSVEENGPHQALLDLTSGFILIADSEEMYLYLTKKKKPHNLKEVLHELEFQQPYDDCIGTMKLLKEILKGIDILTIEDFKGLQESVYQNICANLKSTEIEL